jgi:pSer/pThr/pTyr-binding forkhead associated (FHA) protein
MTTDPAMAAFLEACGTTGSLELTVEDLRGGAVTRQAFNQPFVVVGRREGVDLRLDDPDVSQRHAYLQVLSGRLFCLDLLSRTGLEWEHGPAASGWLDHGHTLRIGPFGIRLTGGAPGVAAAAAAAAAGKAPLVARAPEEDTLPAVALEYTARAGSRGAWKMDRVLALVGRAAPCKLRLQDGSGSRYSCSLLRTPAGLWAVDLLGRPGVLVNGRRLRWAHLRDGDDVRVGGVALRVRYDTSLEQGMEGEGIPGAGGRSVRAADVAMREGTLLGREPGPGTANPILPGNLASGLGDSPGGLPFPATLPTLRFPAGILGEHDNLPPVPPLVAQMALLQQHMFDQFVQALLMMGQMFRELQAEQLGEVRKELERMRQINQDLQALQLELARRQAGGAGAAPEQPPDSAVRRPATAGSNEPLGKDEAGRVGEAKATPVQGGQPPPVPGGAAAGGPTAAGPDQDIHLRLSQRIQALEQERESRWQQFLQTLTGRRTGDSKP